MSASLPLPSLTLRQAAVLCQEAATFAQRHAGPGGDPSAVPLLLCGDFNSLWRKYVPDVFDPKVNKGITAEPGPYGSGAVRQRQRQR